MIGDLLSLHSLIFVDVYERAIICMYKHAYFVGLIFAICQTMKIGPLED